MSRPSQVGIKINELMKEGARHSWTLEDLLMALEERDQGADFSTVFRSVTRLELQGVVRKVDVDGTRAHFELNEGHHDHVKCDRCGVVAPVPCTVVSTTLTGVEKSTGFVINGHRLVLNGECPGCAAMGEGPATGAFERAEEKGSRTPGAEPEGAKP